MIKLILPFPPSSNMCYPTGRNRRRFKSKRLKDWIKSCPKLAVTNLCPELAVRAPAPCTVSYVMYFPDDRIRDGQSYMKMVLDYLVSEGVLKDDNRRIVKGEQWIDGGIDHENPRIEITIREFKGA